MNSNLVDVVAERAVLSGLIQYGIDAYVEVADIISHGTFGNSNNQILYQCIEKIIENNSEVDLPSILSTAAQLNFSDIINRFYVGYFNLLHSR